MEKQRLVDGKKSEYTFSVIPRSREVKQSWISTVASTLYAFIHSISIFFKSDGRPDLLLCNGPGTCIPLCVVAILCKLMWIGKPVVIVYVESICRVETLSPLRTNPLLSGGPVCCAVASVNPKISSSNLFGKNILIFSFFDTYQLLFDEFMDLVLMQFFLFESNNYNGKVCSIFPSLRFRPSLIGR